MKKVDIDEDQLNNDVKAPSVWTELRWYYEDSILASFSLEFLKFSPSNFQFDMKKKLAKKRHPDLRYIYNTPVSNSSCLC